MRTICSLAAVLAIAAVSIPARPAAADAQLWRAGILADAPAEPHVFRIETWAGGYIEHPSTTALKSWTAADGAHVASLFADLVNGANNPVTLSTPLFTHTVAESFFTGDLKASPFAVLPYLPPAIDFAGWEYTEIVIQALPRPNGQMLYNLVAYGQLPEPASAMLVVLGCVCLHVIGRGARRRSTRHQKRPRSLAY